MLHLIVLLFWLVGCFVGVFWNNPSICIRLAGISVNNWFGNNNGSGGLFNRIRIFDFFDKNFKIINKVIFSQIGVFCHDIRGREAKQLIRFSLNSCNFSPFLIFNALIFPFFLQFTKFFNPRNIFDPREHDNDTNKSAALDGIIA